MAAFVVALLAARLSTIRSRAAQSPAKPTGTKTLRVVARF
jgi:hypothetical protein